MWSTPLLYSAHVLQVSPPSMPWGIQGEEHAISVLPASVSPAPLFHTQCLWGIHAHPLAPIILYSIWAPSYWRMQCYTRILCSPPQTPMWNQECLPMPLAREKRYQSLSLSLPSCFSSISFTMIQDLLSYLLCSPCSRFSIAAYPLA